MIIFYLDMQKGFIQIPVLIAIIIGLLVLGGGGYLGVKQYQEHQQEKLAVQEQQQKIEDEKEKLAEDEKIAKEVELQTFMEGQQNALKDAQLEIEGLKKQSELQKITSTLTKVGALSNAEIISKVKSSVVYVETTKGSGSGFVIDDDGYVLTNAHVVWDVNFVDIYSVSGHSFGQVVGRDEEIDLALIKLEPNELKPVILGNSDTLRQGDDVFTLGFPFGIKADVSFKEGTISRTIEDGDYTYLETSAEIHPGNSGGPLVNDQGEVVGINTAVLGNSIGGITVGETIKFAIPINTAKNLITELKNGRNVVIEHPETSHSNNKVSCDNYKDGVVNKYADLTNVFVQSEIDAYYIVDEVFYSPVAGSCLYKFRMFWDKDWQKPQEQINSCPSNEPDCILITYSLRDWLTDETIYHVIVSSKELEESVYDLLDGGEGSTKLNEFRNRVDYYKGG